VPGVLATGACTPQAPPRNQRDVPRHQRGVPAGSRFLAFRGRADQMGGLAEVASAFQVIAVDSEPSHGKFTRDDLAVLRAGGRNLVLGIVNVGICDRTSTYWSTAPEGLLPCVANLPARIGERAGHPQQVWMGVDDFEYQRLIVEYIAPRIEKTDVDGFLFDGLDLLDHDPDDGTAPCDEDCVEGGVSLLTELRKDFPELVFLIQGGISRRARTEITSATTALLVDGVVGEDVYAPTRDAEKEADLLAWQALGLKVNGQPLAIVTQDYVASCDDAAAAKAIYQSSSVHGFSAAVSPSPATSRARVCPWSLGK
jgi:cysteinyl-tRNA synthetase